MSIIRNAVRCKLCNDTIESVHVHDFKTCKCGFVSVDGGKYYLKRSWDVTKIKDKKVSSLSYEEVKKYWEELSE